MDTAVGTEGFTHYVHGLIGMVLDRLCVPFLLVGADGRLLFVNPMAETILDDGRHIARHESGQLVCRSVVSELVIQDFLAGMATSTDEIDILLHGVPGIAPLFASLSRFQPPQFNGFAPLAPVAVVFIRDGYEEEGIEVARLLYQLSEAEADSVRAVVAGTPLKRHAEARKVSVHTVRKQLNTAMKKAGVCSQLELQTLIHELTRGPEPAVRG